MRISTLLAEKGAAVATITGDAPVIRAVGELTARRIGALVVSSDGRHIDGIVSERDVVRGLNEHHGSVLDEPVSSIMTSTVFTCSPDDDIESLRPVMTERRIRHVPVVRDGELCGIVSIGDVVKIRIDELETERTALTHYITGTR